MAMETVRFFLKHYPAGAAEAFRLFTSISPGHHIKTTCICFSRVEWELEAHVLLLHSAPAEDPAKLGAGYRERRGMYLLFSAEAGAVLPCSQGQTVCRKCWILCSWRRGVWVVLRARRGAQRRAWCSRWCCEKQQATIAVWRLLKSAMTPCCCAVCGVVLVSVLGISTRGSVD
jgi:hypothetical protein